MLQRPITTAEVADAFVGFIYYKTLNMPFSFHPPSYTTKQTNIVLSVLQLDNSPPAEASQLLFIEYQS